jgi:hypothetical protein
VSLLWSLVIFVLRNLIIALVDRAATAMIFSPAVLPFVYSSLRSHEISGQSMSNSHGCPPPQKGVRFPRVSTSVTALAAGGSGVVSTIFSPTVPGFWRRDNRSHSIRQSRLAWLSTPTQRCGHGQCACSGS